MAKLLRSASILAVALCAQSAVAQQGVPAANSPAHSGWPVQDTVVTLSAQDKELFEQSLAKLKAIYPQAIVPTISGRRVGDSAVGEILNEDSTFIHVNLDPCGTSPRPQWFIQPYRKIPVSDLRCPDSGKVHPRVQVIQEAKPNPLDHPSSEMAIGGPKKDSERF